MTAAVEIMTSKPVVIGIITLLLMIPLTLIESKIAERSAFHQQVVEEISASWTGAQQVIGPLVVVEYQTVSQEQYWSKEAERFLERTVHTDEVAFLPLEAVSADIELKTEKRYRGIHEVPVYRSTMTFSGSYDPVGMAAISATADFHRFTRRYLWIYVADRRGFTDLPTLSWGDAQFEFAAGGHVRLDHKGILVAPDDETWSRAADLHVEVGLNGTQSMTIGPTATSLAVVVRSDWDHPKFVGRFLPIERNVDEGFTARWRLTELATDARSVLDRCAKGDCDQLGTFGVELIEPVNIYSMAERAVKYGILFIVIVFAAFLLTELVLRLEVHPLQYLMLGAAVSIFYLLLIALSEQMPFVAAYLIATTMCTGLLTYYAAGIMASLVRGLAFGGYNVLLFAVLYVILQSEDHALLMGSMLSFCVLTALMVATRKVAQIRDFDLGFDLPAASDVQ